MEKLESDSASRVEEGDEDMGSYNTSNVKKAKLQSTLAALLEDPVLSDVPNNPSLSDVDTLISIEFGSAMRISVLKLDGTTFGEFCGVCCVKGFWEALQEEKAQVFHGLSLLLQHQPRF